MSYSNVDIGYTQTRSDEGYTMLPYPNHCENFYAYFSPEHYSYMKRREDPLANAEVSSSSDVKTGQLGRSPPEEESEYKKQLRRMQNREAASRCRRKKMERISLLQDTLSRMYNRCQELRQSISAVEAQVRELKAAGYGQHPIPFLEHHSMKNELYEGPMPDLCLCVAVTNGNQPVMEPL